MAKRKAYDFYPTGQKAAKQMLDRLPFTLSGSVFEPCIGTADIAAPLRDRGLTVWANDIDPSREADFHLDATHPESWAKFPEVHWVITNPPFSHASKILPLAYEHAQVGVIFLLRLSYSEPCQNRAKWLQRHQNKQSIIYPPKRISFIGDGKTDNVASCWFVWGKSGRLCDPFIYPAQKQNHALFGLLEPVAS
ncbi:MAG: hypothetical protein AAF810_01435 [Cyanobacteria bacterium P01_D01_bin.36]